MDESSAEALCEWMRCHGIRAFALPSPVGVQWTVVLQTADGDPYLALYQAVILRDQEEDS